MNARSSHRSGFILDQGDEVNREQADARYSLRSGNTLSDTDTVIQLEPLRLVAQEGTLRVVQAALEK